MKDGNKRQRKAEHGLIRVLPDVEPNLAVTPVDQESLDMEWDIGRRVVVQGNEFVVTSSDNWCLQVYVLTQAKTTTELSTDSMSKISDEALIPTHFRKPLWCGVRREVDYIDRRNSILFVAPDVIGFTMSANVSTWYVRTGELLESISVSGRVEFSAAMCKISNTEFASGSSEGHILFFTHNRGHNLQEETRVRKAHSDGILSMEFHKDIIISTSFDWSARVWDSSTKKRVAILKHCAPVVGVTISDEYIVTCSFSESDTGELRFYKNENAYELVKIVHIRNWVYKPIILNGGLILCRLYCRFMDNFQRNYLYVVDFERERVIAHLKVGCRRISDYDVLLDGRIVAVGMEGCCGVIVKFPRRVRKLVKPRNAENEREGGPHRMCVLM